MLRVVATAITPVILTLLSPFGITETTPVGEAITLLVLALGTGAMAFWVEKSHRQD